MTLRAMVVGAGSVGEGHALALSQTAAEVVAIASRTADVVRRVADDLAIPVATTEWRTALADLRPDIVAIATPGDSHPEMIEAALGAALPDLRRQAGCGDRLCGNLELP